METKVHISHSRLLESTQGADLAARERQHIDSCNDCAFTLNWLETMKGMRGVESSPEPPAAIVAAAVDLAPSSAQRLLKQLKALLVFDSFDAPLPAGIRPYPSDTRQLVYEGWLLEITIQVNDAGSGRMTVAGQLTMKPDKQGVAHAQICLVSDRERLEAYSDDTGQFMLDSISSHDYSCEVRYNDIGVTIDRLPPPLSKGI